MKLSAFITVFLFATVSTLPYRILGYYPFRKQLRFSTWKLAILIGVSQLLQSSIYAWTSETPFPQRATDAVFAIVCFLIYMISVDADHWKTLFLYVFLFDFTVVVRGSAYFIEARLFYSPALVFDSPRSILINVLLLVATLPFMVAFLKRTKDLIFHTDAPSLWHIIWILPAFTTVIVMMYTADISPENVYQFRFFFSRVLLILGMFGVYWVLLQSLDVIRHEAMMAEQAAQQENLLAFQRTQYSQLTRHIEETRQARHDLAQHLRIINSYLNTGDEEALREYVAHYEQSLPPDTHRSWCKNYAVNTLIHYYCEESEKSGIDFIANLNLPSDLPISEPEFCSVLGNLLENALLACREVKDTAPFTRILAKANGRQIILTVDNTCAETPTVKDGHFLSSRHDGYGLGTASVRTIAQRNNGNADFRYENGMFYASVMLNCCC